MFNTISFISFTSPFYNYIVYDTDFNQNISILDCLNAPARALAVVIRCYKERNLPVVPSVVALYLIWLKTININITEYSKHRQTIDEYYPELEYGKLYYRCVVNHINKHLYLSGSHQRIPVETKR